MRIKDIATVEQGPKIRLGQISKTYRDENGKLIDNPDVVEGTVLLQKGANADPALKGIEAKVKELNDFILPKGVKVVAIPRPQRPAPSHHPHGSAQPDRRHHPGRHRPDALPGQRARRHHRCAHDSVLAAVCLHLPQPQRHSRKPALARRARLRHGGRGRGGDGGKHRSPSESPNDDGTDTPQDKIREPRTRCSVQSSMPSASSSLRTFPSSRCRRSKGRLFKPMAWTVAFALLGALIYSMVVAPVLSSLFFPKGAKEWRNVVMEFLEIAIAKGVTWAIHHRIIPSALELIGFIHGDLPALQRDRFGVPAPSG
jgi:cobalt-zinc-cadmium resistance protein CzcA